MDNTTIFPTLYKTDSRNVKRSWSVEAQNAIVRRTYGVVGGKMIVSERECKPMNTGRANATNATQQAMLEAKREWVAQLDKQYEPDPSDNEGQEMYASSLEDKKQTGGQNRKLTKVQPTTNNKLVKPMLLQKFENVPKCLKYFNFKAGVYVEPKYDGIHVIAMVDPDTNQVIFTSRNLKLFPHMLSLKAAVRKFIGNRNVVLDGEVYAHEIIQEDKTVMEPDCRFQAITSACKVGRSEPHQYEDQLNFYVFDMIDTTMCQQERMKQLEALFCRKSERVKLCPYKIIHDVSELEPIHDQYVKDGYEGVVIRAHDSMYEPDKRSLRVRKYKTFDDEEFQIVGANSEDGDGDYKNKKLVVWICVTTAGVKFNCVPTGGDHLRNKWWDNHKKYIGKYLKVKYQGVSSDGIPRFPIGICFRDMSISNGKLVSEQ